VPILLIVLSVILGFLFLQPILVLVGIFILSPALWILGLILYFLMHPWLRKSLESGDAIIYSANALMKPIDPSVLQSGGGFGWGWFGGWGFGGGGGSSWGGWAWD
jgi:uncharacterized membrane protein YgcG